MLTIENHGPLIVRTNYWETEHARHGLLYCSINAGAIRLLVPASQVDQIAEMRTAREVIVSRGPSPAEGLPDAIEILFDDGSESPYSVLLGLDSIDRLPLDTDAGRELVCSVWVDRRGRPHRALERPAWYRRVSRLPCLQPWPTERRE